MQFLKLLLLSALVFSSACFSVPRVSVEQQLARQQRVDALLWQGVLLLRKNTSESVRLAESSFSSVVEILPSDPRGYDGLACVKLRFGENEVARDYFREALQKDASYEPAYVHLAFLDEMEGDFSSAAENYQKALLINPLNHRARFNYAIFLKDLKKRSAGKEFEKIVLIESAAKH